MHLETWSSSGWVLMTNIFLGSKSMDHQLSNALSTMFLRHLVMFLHFEIYALVNPQKRRFCRRSGVQLGFLPHLYMNAVILRYRNCGGKNGETYIKPSFSSCTCRTTLIQRALDKGMSCASNARSPDIFGPFPTILRHWKVENFWKKHWKNGILNLNFELPGAWFSKNRQKSLSAVAKSFLRVAWCSKLYQKIAWTLRSIFHTHNVPRKCLEKILRAKN